METNLFSVAGRVALITGASSGIGHTLAKGLARAGANIVAVARRKDKLAALVGDIEQAGGKAIAVDMDVTDIDSIKRAFDTAEQHFGVCDIIVNNAGVADPKSFLKVDEQSLDQVMNTNFRGVWHVAQQGAKRLVNAARPGSIINIASILGLNAQFGQSTYCSSKGAVIQLTKTMALDLGHYNIRVNAIAPGWFETEMNEAFFKTDQGKAFIRKSPAGRTGQLEELVGPVLLLASEAGSFINGTTLPVDGAHHTTMAG